MPNVYFGAPAFTTRFETKKSPSRLIVVGLPSSTVPNDAVAFRFVKVCQSGPSVRNRTPGASVATAPPTRQFAAFVQ